MKTKVTKKLLDQVHEEGGLIYWEDFLGNFGNKTRSEDRIFTTAMAINVLLDTWTYK